MTWPPGYVPLWLPNTVSMKHKLLFPPHKALLNLTLPTSFMLFPTTLLLAIRSSQAGILHFWANSFDSSGHFHWLFPLPGTLCLQIDVWVVSHHSGFSSMSFIQKSHPGVQAISRSEVILLVTLDSHSTVYLFS